MWQYCRVFHTASCASEKYSGLSYYLLPANLAISVFIFSCIFQGIDETVRALGEALSESDDSNPSAAPVVDYSQYLECDENSLRGKEIRVLYKIRIKQIVRKNFENKLRVKGAVSSIFSITVKSQRHIFIYGSLNIMVQ